MNVGYIHGRFNEFSGTFAFADKGGSLAVEINVSSIDTNNKMRANHCLKAIKRSIRCGSSTVFTRCEFRMTALKL